MPRSPEQYKEIREERRKHMVETALALFAEKGYQGTSISQIAKEAKVSKGLLYNYFSGKEDLLKAIIVEISADVMQRIPAPSGSEVSEADAVQFIDTLVESLVENPHKWRLFYQLAMHPDVMQKLLDAHIIEQVAEDQQVLLNYFMRYDFDQPQVDMLLFSSIMKGFGMQYVFAPELFDAALLEAFKEKFKNMFRRPLRTGSIPDLKLDLQTRYILT